MVCSALTDIKGVRYNITNEAIIGACFLPAGLGNISALTPSSSRSATNKWCSPAQSAPLSQVAFPTDSSRNGSNAVGANGSQKIDYAQPCSAQPFLFPFLSSVRVLSRITVEGMSGLG